TSRGHSGHYDTQTLPKSSNGAPRPTREQQVASGVSTPGRDWILRDICDAMQSIFDGSAWTSPRSWGATRRDHDESFVSTDALSLRTVTLGAIMSLSSSVTFDPRREMAFTWVP